jgi:hypothetical protein
MSYYKLGSACDIPYPITKTNIAVYFTFIWCVVILFNQNSKQVENYLFSNYAPKPI